MLFDCYNPFHSLRHAEKTAPACSISAVITEAYDYLQADYQTQERSKNFDFALASDWDFSLDHLIQTFRAADSITTARQVVQRVKQPAREGFWGNFDRLAIMGAGGAFLGGAVVQLFGGGSVQILGALVGAVIGILSGWFVTFRPSTSRRNSQN